jgi:hypothetical protein
MVGMWLSQCMHAQGFCCGLCSWGILVEWFLVGLRRGRNRAVPYGLWVMVVAAGISVPLLRQQAAQLESPVYRSPDTRLQHMLLFERLPCAVYSGLASLNGLF